MTIVYQGRSVLREKHDTAWREVWKMATGRKYFQTHFEPRPETPELDRVTLWEHSALNTIMRRNPHRKITAEGPGILDSQEMKALDIKWVNPRERRA